MQTTGDKGLLEENVDYLVHPPKGILAADESAKTCCKRFDDVHLECTDESRRAFREMIITSPDLEKYISGIILTDETIRQSTAEGKPFVHVLMEKGIKVGIKVDEGIAGFRDEHDTEFITKGLETLLVRIPDYKMLGASFAKWRAAFSVTHGLPTAEVLIENMRRMAEYAAICQMNSIVPIVEPEVLMDGNHSIHDAEDTVRKVLSGLIDALKERGVFIPGVIVKTSMVVSGKNAETRAKAEEVALRTVSVLKDTMPNDIGGVVYLSGGQSFAEADENYDAIRRHAEHVPFPMTFSFSRAFQNTALDHYAKNPSDITGSQKILIETITHIAQL